MRIVRIEKGDDMSKLREAAQAVIDKHNPRTNMSDWWDALDRLRAALAQPETEAEPVAWAVMCDGNVTQTWLTEIAATRIADNLRAQNRGRDFDWQTAPLYTHLPRDEWRPASEPPKNGRDVVVWMQDGEHGVFAVGHCLRGKWTPNYVGSPVTHWRDIDGPMAEGA